MSTTSGGRRQFASDNYAGICPEALAAMQDHLRRSAPTVQVMAVAHRIVHGGPHFRAPVVLDEAVLAMLGTLEPLAPLHQPHNLAGVRALRRAYPGLPQIGCFDTAFHASLPRIEQRYALTDDLHEQGLRRYGFHGLSYQYVMQALQRRSAAANGHVLMAHLGSGASLCAASGGISVATSMGFSALDGLVMGSRCGQLDPGIVLHLWRQGWSLAQVENLLYRESGLRGVSGLSADLRELHLLTLKPIMYVANVNESGFTNNPQLDAVKARAAKEGRLDPETVTPELFATRLFTGSVPPALTGLGTGFVGYCPACAMVGRRPVDREGGHCRTRRQRRVLPVAAARPRRAERGGHPQRRGG